MMPVPVLGKSKRHGDAAYPNVGLRSGRLLVERSFHAKTLQHSKPALRQRFTGGRPVALEPPCYVEMPQARFDSKTRGNDRSATPALAHRESPRRGRRYAMAATGFREAQGTRLCSAC